MRQVWFGGDRSTEVLLLIVGGCRKADCTEDTDIYKGYEESGV